MRDKPQCASGYPPGASESIRRALLSFASKLGDVLDDVVVVGGFVPWLLVDQSSLPLERLHAGTLDLDLALSVALLADERYRSLAAGLREAGFRPDKNDAGNPTRQRWEIERRGESVTIDFLITQNAQNSGFGKITNIDRDLGAFTMEGVELAFVDYRRIEVQRSLSEHETITRTFKVCGPAAAVVLKALAFGSRTANKDAYDLFYILREVGLEEVVASFRKLPMDDPSVRKALATLHGDFIVNNTGRVRVAQFLGGARDEGVESLVLAFVSDLLRRLEWRP